MMTTVVEICLIKTQYSEGEAKHYIADDISSIFTSYIHGSKASK